MKTKCLLAAVTLGIPLIVTVCQGQFMTYSVSDGEGGWITPDDRCFFAKGMGDIQQTVNGKAISCPLVFQDVAYVLDKDGKRTKKLTVSAYGGASFAVPDALTVVKDKEMRKEIVIEIESVEKGILLTKKTSAVPFIQSESGLESDCRMFRNVTWVFTTNMTFSTKADEYTVEKPGATVSFTKDGVILKDIAKKNK